MKNYGLVSVFIMSCMGSVGAVADSNLVIAGTGDSQVLLSILGEQFERVHGEVSVEVPESIGSSGGIKAVSRGKVDLARTARPLEEREKPGLVEVLFAKSPIVFTVHPSVTGVHNLTVEQILGIYAGKHVNWQELGGPDHKIYVLDRETDDSSRRLITSTFPKFTALESAVRVAYSTPEAVDLLTKNQFTLGYLPLSVAQHEQLTVLPLQGMAPTENTYPLLTPFYLVFKSPANQIVEQFLAFIFSPPGQEIMKEAGVIPTNPSK